MEVVKLALRAAVEPVLISPLTGVSCTVPKSFVPLAKNETVPVGATPKLAVAATVALTLNCAPAATELTFVPTLLIDVVAGVTVTVAVVWLEL